MISWIASNPWPVISVVGLLANLAVILFIRGANHDA
jgi:hypothetical protein